MARTNKAQPYVDCGHKERLFDAICLASLERVTNVVSIDAIDLAHSAARLYDEYLRRRGSSARAERAVTTPTRRIGRTGYLCSRGGDEGRRV
ncbi:MULTISPECIES: hypothetical protein [unclassified Streptomyces]|uniref:hypothetical protein n=1 Tax=unclassified Streptomyces TaxID=2593676 RepID=UPI0016487F47